MVNVGTKLSCGVLLIAALWAGAPCAEAQERSGDPWHFEHERGWRFEHRPGVWSQYYVWWWVNGHVVLLAAPAVRVVQFSNGRYELHGNGITVPYQWVWVQTSPVVAPPPPPAFPPPPSQAPPVGSIPLPPPTSR